MQQKPRCQEYLRNLLLTCFASHPELAARSGKSVACILLASPDLTTKQGKEVNGVGRTASANAGTGIHDGRPSVEPSAEQSSVMRTGLGAVALYTPSNDRVASAAMYRFTRSSLRTQARVVNPCTYCVRRGGIVLSTERRRHQRCYVQVRVSLGTERKNLLGMHFSASCAAAGFALLTGRATAQCHPTPFAMGSLRVWHLVANAVICMSTRRTDSAG